MISNSDINEGSCVSCETPTKESCGTLYLAMISNFFTI